MVRRMSEATERSFLGEVIDQQGLIEPDQLAGALRVTKSELAVASGLSRDAVSKTLRLRAPATQARLREGAAGFCLVPVAAAPGIRRSDR